MKDGEYKTEAGSHIRKSGSRVIINFEWLDEENSCIDCDPYVENECLMWNCESCGHGVAELEAI